MNEYFEGHLYKANTLGYLVLAWHPGVGTLSLREMSQSIGSCLLRSIQYPEHRAAQNWLLWRGFAIPFSFIAYNVPMCWALCDTRSMRCLFVLSTSSPLPPWPFHKFWIPSYGPNCIISYFLNCIVLLPYYYFLVYTFNCNWSYHLTTLSFDLKV